MVLTDQQAIIACKMDGKFLVLAGAGSGKTYTLTQRIITLIQEGIQPETITAVSFTKKASNEIKDRTLNFFPAAQGVKFGTFHSLCLKILKYYPAQLIELQLISDEEFIILDEKDRATLINRFVEQSRPGVYDPQLLERVVIFLNKWGRKLDFPTVESSNDPEVFRIWWKIQQEKVKLNYVDFDDILKYTFLLLNSYAEIREIVSKKIRFLLVDEAQDLNDIQFRIAESLSSYWNNLMIIGDDLQSIYKFRGAKVENFINLGTSNPSIETLKLTKNFRSSEIIVKASNALISLNKNQIPKEAYSEIKSSSLIDVNIYEDKSDEGEKVTQMIQQDLLNGYVPGSIAVLFRNRNMIKEIEDNFIKKKIPYYVSGSNNFFDLPLVQHLVKIARLIVHPNDELALEQCILQIEGIDEQICHKLMYISNHYGVSLARVIMSIEKWNCINPEAVSSLKLFWDNFYSKVITYQKNLKAMESVAEKISYCYNLTNQYTKKKTITDNGTIKRLIGLIESLLITEEVSMNASIFEILNLIKVSYDEKEEDNKVGLLTIHSVKGLEFRKVYIVGLEAGNFPSFHAVSEQQLEEERRLMYVAMTRAKEKLILNHVRKRFYGGNEYSCKPSQFIDEIPSEYLRKI